MNADYLRFLDSKALRAVPTGIEPPADLGSHLFPFQADIVRWALRRGRAAVFADCGMGKSRIALEWLRHVVAHTGKPGLILTPLAVAQQFKREGEAIGIDVTVCRTADDVRNGINVINYDRLHLVDARAFGAIVADEASILKDYTSATRNAVIESFVDTPFRLSCTATPAPNDHMELGNQAEFLGVLSRTEMLATFFTHDGGETQKWVIKKHGTADFWKWVCSWAALVRRPSDLGYDDGAYVLPELRMLDHIVPSDPELARKAGKLFIDTSSGLQEQRAARRSSLEARVEVARGLVEANPEGPWLLWCELNDEGDALEKAIPGAVQVKGSDSAEHKETEILKFALGETRVLISKASIMGHGVNLQVCADVAFVGIGYSFESFYQAIRRNWRFGQRRPVNCHLITSDAEGGASAALRRKEAQAEEMAARMSVHTREMVLANVRGARNERLVYAPTKCVVVPPWLRSEAS
jgi:hypothetical protein